MYVNIMEGDKGGDGPGKSDRLVTTEVIKEKEKGINSHYPGRFTWTISPYHDTSLDVDVHVDKLGF
jgi:hypothetical protein